MSGSSMDPGHGYRHTGYENTNLARIGAGFSLSGLGFNFWDFCCTKVNWRSLFRLLTIPILGK